MASKTRESHIARFDARLSKEQKEFFEEAVILGGFRSLSDFVISSAMEKAKRILEEQKTLWTSKKDREKFFNALLNPPKANSKLKSAAKAYKQA
ncbi:MAG TPA: DUF1778 domain-containing protein [Cyclobacteriaceae bacterium]|nr:DUF1778 domain-containing protein [Cyclobacteriaceae bacterium]HMV08366.1 DUF1778 domain-containing protein [Cyclobacteriaceae bacterium]HMV89707.1 DUF1778 domain-containing protein [Cyclobacteriaceae bacterium]HMX01139.1 DUF1778 domain-containing protein [Cyclobacteriaceae bacterium]HMX50542.1 DUF1778 domain-containing protein [Cyclobacteriaceae bacterium]